MDTAPAHSLADELVRFIEREVSADAGADINADTDLVMTGLVDSLGVVMIVEWLERRIDVQIDPADVVIEHFGSVGAILDYLDARGDGVPR